MKHHAHQLDGLPDPRTSLIWLSDFPRKSATDRSPRGLYRCIHCGKSKELRRSHVKSGGTVSCKCQRTARINDYWIPIAREYSQSQVDMVLDALRKYHKGTQHQKPMPHGPACLKAAKRFKMSKFWVSAIYSFWFPIKFSIECEMKALRRADRDLYMADPSAYLDAQEARIAAMSPEEQALQDGSWMHSDNIELSDEA